MTKFFSLAAVFWAATAIYCLSVEIFAPLGINVGIMLVFALIVANVRGAVTGYFYAFFSGLFLDFFGSELFGGYALVFVITTAIFYRVKDKMDFEEACPQLTIAFALNAACAVLYALAGKIFTGKFIWRATASMLIGSVITAVLPLVFYGLVKKVLLLGMYAQKTKAGK
jgi:rod shape-determining protein MreD